MKKKDEQINEMDKKIKNYEFEELKRQNDIISGVVGKSNKEGNNFTVDQS